MWFTGASFLGRPLSRAPALGLGFHGYSSCSQPMGRKLFGGQMTLSHELPKTMKKTIEIYTMIHISSKITVMKL